MSETVRESLQPTIGELQHTFTTTAREIGDAAIDAFDDGRALFARAVFPDTIAVRSGDRVRRGVAMRTAGREVLIHPYTLRDVCTNGAVRAHATSTRIVRREWLDAEIVSAHGYAVGAVLADVASAIRGCAEPAVFAEGADEMRAALEVEADEVLEALALHDVIAALGTSDVAATVRRLLLRQMRQLSRAGGRERSAFAFGNALTAAGRDAPSPVVRWTLEEYGAAVFGAARRDGRPPKATIGGKDVVTATTDQD